METKERRPAGRPEQRRRPAAQSRAGRPAENRRPPVNHRPSENRRPPDNRRPADPRTARRTAPVRRPQPAGKPQQTRKPQNQTAVRYTDPRPFSGKKILLQLLTVFAVVLAVLFGMSIFFKVDLQKATVAGNVKYTVNEIMEASGIRGGSNLLTLSDAQISGSIKAKLPYVNSVRVGIKLPDTVNIEIQELAVPYSLEDTDGNWWLIGSDGKIVDTISMSEAKTYTQLVGIRIQDAEMGMQASACDPEPEETQPAETRPAETAAESTPDSEQQESVPAESTEVPAMKPVIMTGAEQMEMVLSILENLESNGFIGTIATVDVTDPNAIELWYESRYQVTLGNTKNLAYKISMLKAAVDQMGVHQSGQLDVSFTTWPDQVGYTPFA